MQRAAAVCTPALGLWAAWWMTALPPVHAAAPAAAPTPLVQLAAAAQVAVVAPDLASLQAQLPPVLLWVGLAFPQAQPSVVGTLAGQDGAVNILNAAHTDRLELPPNAPVAVLRFPTAPSPVLAVQDLTGDACQRLREKLGGGAPEHAAAWEKRGVCLVAVGECSRHGCSAMGVPKPSSAGQGGTAARAAWLAAAGGVRVLASGAWLRAFVGARLADLELLDAVAARVEAQATPWKVWGVSFWTRAPVDPRALRPLPTPLHGSAQPVVQWTVWPAADSVTRMRASPARALQRLSGTALGADPPELWSATPWSWDWRGLELRPLAQGPAALLGNVWAVHQGQPYPQAATRCQAYAASQARAAGLPQDAGLWTNGTHSVVAAQQDGRCSLLTNAAAESGIPTTALLPPPFPLPQPALLQGQLHGRRLLAALRRVPVLHTGGNPPAQAAVAAGELLGPMLERLDDAQLWAWPQRGGKTWEAFFTLDVRGPAR